MSLIKSREELDKLFKELDRANKVMMMIDSWYHKRKWEKDNGCFAPFYESEYQMLELLHEHLKED